MSQIKTIEQLNLIVNTMIGSYCNVILDALYSMPKAEVDKIPTIGMTQEQYNTINNHCVCIDIMEDFRVYSCGGSPFKIHIKKDN